MPVESGILSTKLENVLYVIIISKIRDLDSLKALSLS